MFKKKIVLGGYLVLVLVITFVLVLYDKSTSMEIKEKAKIYNERGLKYFKEAKFKLEARGKFDEAAIKYKEAVSEFKKAIEEDPSYAEAHANLGRVYIFLKRFSEAVKEYEIVVDLMPNEIDDRLDLASAYEKAGRYDDAIQQLKVIITLTSHNEAKEFFRALIKKLEEANQ